MSTATTLTGTVIVTCPGCGLDREVAESMARRIASGIYSGRCLKCAHYTVVRNSDWRDDLANLDYASAVLSRLILNVDGHGPCWEWQRSKTVDGYGQISIKKKMVRVHQIAWHILVGPVPHGMQLDHLCRNRSCCNPDHLEPVAPAVNSQRGVGGAVGGLRQRSKTHCPQGHPYTEQNTYIRWRDGHPGRRCRKCRAEGMRKRSTE